MKLLTIVSLFILSLSSFAGTITNRKTDELVNISCLEMQRNRCQNYMITAELKDKTVTKLISYKMKMYKDTEFFNGTIAGSVTPFIVGALIQSMPLIVLGIVITPVTVALGVGFDIINAPIKAIRNLRDQKLRKNLKTLFSTKKSKETSKRAFKKLIAKLSII
ncbi:MAG: hypothetical protein ACI9QD_000157 [Thermoproteota archaeon]|jgi:hypothetical protein